MQCAQVESYIYHVGRRWRQYRLQLCDLRGACSAPRSTWLMTADPPRNRSPRATRRCINRARPTTTASSTHAGCLRQLNYNTATKDGRKARRSLLAVWPATQSDVQYVTTTSTTRAHIRPTVFTTPSAHYFTFKRPSLLSALYDYKLGAD